MKKIKRITIKVCFIFLAISASCVLLFFLIQKKIKPLDQSRVALIDVIENNYIFRGNNLFVPKNGEMVFAYDELTSYFNSILLKQGHKPLNDYYLVDISLLDFDHYQALEKEKQFFIDNPDYGMMVNISTLSPNLLFGQFSDSNILTSSITKSYKLWLTDVLTKIHNMASRQTDKPVVIYIHCNAGRDRTGMLVAGYKMLFNNMNLTEVRSQNKTETGRNSVNLYNQAIGSYCLYVKQTYQKPDNYCTETGD